MKFSLIFLVLFYFQTTRTAALSPGDEVKIISKVGKCDGDLKRKLVKNISQSQLISVTIKKVVWIDGIAQSPTMLTFEKLAPEEKRDIDCIGCSFKDFHNICTYITIGAASYVTP